MENIIVIILAGGIGKRFWPLKIHKSMVGFLGKQLILHNLEMLKKIGVKKVIIVRPQKEQSLEQIQLPGMSIEYAVQSDAEGMADAVMQAKNLAGTAPCLIMNATDVVEEKLYKDIKDVVKRGKMFITGKKITEYFDGGYLKIENNRLVEIIEKPGKGNEPSNLTNLVFHYFPNSSLFFETILGTKSDKDDVYERALSKMLEQTHAGVLSYDGYWQPLKYPWHILDLMEYFLSTKCAQHKGKNVEIKSNVVLEGAVYIGDNVRIFENTKIIGPCYIGDNTIIGNNNIIRHSHIGSGCVTGFNTDITRSYIGDNCWFHSNYIGDSILEGNISLGSGAVLANLRLDEKNISSYVAGKSLDTKRNKLGAVIGRNVRIGVNTSIMPGIKIGANSFIGSGLVVDRDIPDESFCIMDKTHMLIKKNHQSAPGSREDFKKKI